MANDLNVTSIPIFDRPADYAESFAAGTGAVDLTARPDDMPQQAAQWVDAFNEGATSQEAVVTTIRGKTLTALIPAGHSYRFLTPCTALEAGSGADVSFTVYWWKVPGTKNSAAS
jgi:hypothetical protein